MSEPGSVPAYVPGTTSEALAALEQPEVLVDPRAFQDGQQRARDALVAFLDTLPEALATRTRDEGRGAAYEVEVIRSTLRRSGLQV